MRQASDPSTRAPPTAQLLSPSGQSILLSFSDLAEQVAKLVPIKSSDLGNRLDVANPVRFRPDEKLVCRLARWPGEDAAVRPVEQVPERGRRSVLVKQIAETTCQTRNPAVRIPRANP